MYQYRQERHDLIFLIYIAAADWHQYPTFSSISPVPRTLVSPGHRPWKSSGTSLQQAAETPSAFAALEIDETWLFQIRGSAVLTRGGGCQALTSVGQASP